MSAYPFSISAEAATWIADQFKESAQELEDEAAGVRGEPEKAPDQAANLIPVLCFFAGRQVSDTEHHLIERYDGGHFMLGWYYPDTIDPGGFIHIEIGDFTLFIHHTTLMELEGKELILETVDVGYPIPASKKRQLLRARPKGGEDSKGGEKISPVS